MATQDLADAVEAASLAKIAAEENPSLTYAFDAAEARRIQAEKTAKEIKDAAEAAATKVTDTAKLLGERKEKAAAAEDTKKKAAAAEIDSITAVGDFIKIEAGGANGGHSLGFANVEVYDDNTCSIK